jgi:hypothetical protein
LKKPMAEFMGILEKKFGSTPPGIKSAFYTHIQISILPPIGTLPAGSIPHANHTRYGKATHTGIVPTIQRMAVAGTMPTIFDMAIPQPHQIKKSIG